jgi:hypothetical protein
MTAGARILTHTAAPDHRSSRASDSQPDEKAGLASDACHRDQTRTPGLPWHVPLLPESPGPACCRSRFAGFRLQPVCTWCGANLRQPLLATIGVGTAKPEVNLSQ